MINSMHLKRQLQPPFRYVLLQVFVFFLICLAITGESLAATRKNIPRTQRPYVINHRTYSPLPSAVGFEEVGIASWYGPDFHGHKTSNGEKYNMYGITAAHKLLPMQTMLLVKNIDNGKETIVRVNDRGPFVQGRIIDLSYGAAKRISLVKSGTARVKIIALGETTFSKKTGKRRFKKHADLQSGEYFVQIGAFTKKYNALSLQEKFLDAGHRAVLREVLINGQTFYRTQVYVGKTLGGARKREQILREKGYKGSFIIAR